jgi:hypothetical protein
MLLELLIMLLENIYGTGIPHGDCSGHRFGKIMAKSSIGLAKEH